MTSRPQPLSLYIHVPFCVAKCRYCDFYSIPFDESLASRFIHALAKEWQLVKKEYHLDNAEIQSVFFGGGTPSLLTAGQWELLDKLLIKALLLSPDVEWTIECNPDSFTQEKAALWLSMGVTRLTFGVQSLDDRELGLLGRPHSAGQDDRAAELDDMMKNKLICYRPPIWSLTEDGMLKADAIAKRLAWFQY